MRSIRCHLPHALTLACVLVIALTTFARVYAAPPPRGAVGGDWQTVDAPGLNGQRITALLADNRGRVWVGAEERGLLAWDGQNWRTFGAAAGLPDVRVVALFSDQQGRLWVSTGGGLGYLPPGGEQLRRIESNGLRALPILAFAQAADGAILLGNASGLDLWIDGALQSVPEFDGLAVQALRTARMGVIWAGTSQGLWRCADGKWQHEPAVGDGRITAIVESPAGRIYVAGEAGLWELHDGVWSRLAAPTKDEMTALAVRDGSIWLGTSQGVLAGQEGVWEAYDPRFLPHARVTALAWGGGDVIWVGTTGGLVAHRPDPIPPHVEIIDVNNLRPGSGAMRLGSDRVERIQLEVGDQATPADRLHVFTRLDGVDPAPRLLTDMERQDLGSVAVYADQALPPGSYVLRAWAQDDAFNRSAESQVTVIIPRLGRGPGGFTFREDLFYVGLAGVALVVTAGATTVAAGKTRRKQAEHRARAAAARVCAVAERSADLYTERLPLRQQHVGEIVGTLQLQNVLLLGRRGMGKTSTLGQVALALPAAGARPVLSVPASLDLASVREPQLFYALMTTATAALQPFAVGSRPRLRWNAGLAADYGEQEFSADLNVLLAWLQPQRRQRLRLVFLLDNASVIDGYESRQRDAFRRLLAAAGGADSPVRLTLAAESTPDVLAGFEDLFQAVILSPLDASAATQLLQEGARGLLEWEPDAIQAVIARAAGNPAMLVALGRVAGCNALAASRLRISISDVP